MTSYYAEVLMQRAAEKENPSGGWFPSQNTSFKEAGDLYQQAANAFRLEKQSKEAGGAFCKEAECREKAGEEADAANVYLKAAKTPHQFKEEYPDLAIRALESAIRLLHRIGQFRQAADREKEIANIWLQGISDIGKACESFERAGEWYSQENAQATANACFKDAADLHAELDHFPVAIELYEKVANYSLTSALTMYSVKDHWLRAGLCALATQDTVTARRNLQRYGTQDATFPSTREGKFLESLVEAIEAGDIEAFTAAVVEFDKITKLDNWKTIILSKIENGIQDEPGLT
ncbi:hypothetical protein BOTBODRAFT_163918 [Botryobasidium botryosum FD-172 SS1]|uniref:Vesicular-fusion protein SEC17 n=1 Tax=Botryobasidium botryosum (strain FD-172 SS1) TaxID=930990 RepID=A0A067M4A8_BOTB1|nr:hypothetical protein BOTBODRAFT_163918 [Botryobasidium botryosum FD-172 SS1]